jgi:hypothetical protein
MPWSTATESAVGKDGMSTTATIADPGPTAADPNGPSRIEHRNHPGLMADHDQVSVCPGLYAATPFRGSPCLDHLDTRRSSRREHRSGMPACRRSLGSRGQRQSAKDFAFATCQRLRRYNYQMDNCREWRIRSAIPALVSIVTGFVAACSNAGTGTAASPTVAASSSAASSPSRAASPTGSPTPYCAAADKLKASVTALKSVDVAHTGLDAIEKQVDTIQANLDEFQMAAKNQFGPQVSELRTSLTNLKTALQAAKSSPDASTLATIATSIAAVGTAYTSLDNAVSSRCG